MCRINFSIPLLSSTSPLEDRRQLAIFLADQLGLTQQEQEVVLYVTDNAGFKEGLPSICAANEKDSNAPGSNALNNSGAAGSDGAEAALQQRVLAVVQDSDRLDAIGAIGIARCLTFGGSFNRVLHDPAILPRTHLTQQQYTDKAAQQTTLNHFHEKLFKLKVTSWWDHYRRLLLALPQAAAARDLPACHITARHKLGGGRAKRRGRYLVKIVVPSAVG